MESEWSPQNVAELYERAEKALERAEALAKRTTIAGLAADETPSPHPQAVVAASPQPIQPDRYPIVGSRASTQSLSSG